jgi:hypothetical protein
MIEFLTNIMIPIFLISIMISTMVLFSFLAIYIIKDLLKGNL